MSDNGIFAPPGQITFLENPVHPVLLIGPSGIKMRGSDNKPLTDLTREELLALIDDLIAVFRR